MAKIDAINKYFIWCLPSRNEIDRQNFNVDRSVNFGYNIAKGIGAKQTETNYTQVMHENKYVHLLIDCQDVQKVHSLPQKNNFHLSEPLINCNNKAE